MNNEEIDLKILRNAMDLAAERGWNQMSLVQAAERADVPVQSVRQRFPCKASLLIYLNRLADEEALAQTYQNQPVSEYLFDLFMSRFDIFQEYRAGFISALHTLPLNPPLTIMMGLATKNSMKWIADSARINRTGIKGMACIKGLMTLWALNMRVWIKDETQDLSQTMASLDQTIQKAGKFAPYFVVHNPENSAEPEAEIKDENFITDQNK